MGPAATTSAQLVQSGLDLFIRLITRPLADDLGESVGAGRRWDARLQICERSWPLSVSERVQRLKAHLLLHQGFHVVGGLLAVFGRFFSQMLLDFRGQIDHNCHCRSSFPVYSTLITGSAWPVDVDRAFGAPQSA